MNFLLHKKVSLKIILLSLQNVSTKNKKNDMSCEIMSNN
jgi:hypothetical protein